MHVLRKLMFRESASKMEGKRGQNDLKIKLSALRGRIFEVLGGFLRGLIFDEFLICKKAAENMRNSRRRRTRGSHPGGSAEGAGSSRGFWSLQGSGKSLQEAFETPRAPASRGRRILMAPPCPPTPKICKNIKHMMSNMV